MWKRTFLKFDSIWKKIIYAFYLLMASCFFVLLTHVISIIRKKEPFDFFIILSLIVIIYYYGLKNPLNISKKFPTYILLIVCIGLNQFPALFQVLQDQYCFSLNITCLKTVEKAIDMCKI